VLYSPLLGPGRFFSFVILYTVGRIPWTGDQPVARLLPTHRTAQAQNKRTQTSMPRVEFEPTTSVFERTKTVHAATVIGIAELTCRKKCFHRGDISTHTVETEASRMCKFPFECGGSHCLSFPRWLPRYDTYPTLSPSPLSESVVQPRI
jgi:hypothetical protein